MALWASSLFSKKEEPGKADTALAHQGVATAKPLTVSHQKQPLQILKKLAPIRDLPEDDIAQIEQSTLTYQAGSVIFKLGQKSEHIYYLLEGCVELESDGGASYSITAGSALANLPLNSGKVCGASATIKKEKNKKKK